jgi:hypothetical protein
MCCPAKSPAMSWHIYGHISGLQAGVLMLEVSAVQDGERYSGPSSFEAQETVSRLAFLSFTRSLMRPNTQVCESLQVMRHYAHGWCAHAGSHSALLDQALQ